MTGSSAGEALLRAKQRLAHARIDGIDWYWPAADRPASARWRPDESVRLLTPFDPIVWDRRRFEIFWGWAYRFEAYTPAAKRKLGYYALPLLWHERVIGWGNVTATDGGLRCSFGYTRGRAPRDAAFRALDRVPLLVRSKGAEIGIRSKAIEGLTSSLAVFVLDFDSELLFVGDAGTTEPSRPSRRVGVEWTNQYKVLPWMTLDFDLAYTHARFSNFDPVGDFIPGAPAWVASGGVTFGGDSGWFGALRARYFGPRPLIEDDSVRSQQSLIFNARAGYKFDNGMRLQLDVLNLFNAQTNQIEYYYLSRLPGEPIGGVADRHVHPAEPLAVRLTLAARF